VRYEKFGGDSMVTNRVTGLISGLDTETLVKQMMAVSQSKYDSIMAKKAQTEWKVQLYNDIHKGLKDLSDKFMNMSLTQGNNPKTTTVSDSSVATVTADGNAANANHTLVVGQLATTASLISGNTISTPGADKTTIGQQFGGSVSGTGSFTITQGTGASAKTVNISVNAGESLSEVVKRINDADIGVKAVYDTTLDRVFLSADKSGEAGSFTITGDGATGTDFINALKLTNTNGTVSTSAIGQDSLINLDGATFKQDKNDFIIAGLHISLKDAGTSGRITTIDVKSDNTKLIENVKGLVEEYNKMMELINGKTSEKVYRDYGPLTDAQRKEMKESEITLWEEKAKSGLLRNDDILSKLASNMRIAMYSSYNNVQGDYKTLSSIGISTTSYKDNGKLTIDEAKLTQALNDDPDAVNKLFSGPNGLVNKIRSTIETATKSMEATGGAGKAFDTESTWAKQLDKYDDQLTAMAKKMKLEEERYYTQFANLEKTLSNMNSSSSYLLSSLGGGQ
jgi:flagellar hook-associated protein 2